MHSRPILWNAVTAQERHMTDRCPACPGIVHCARPIRVIHLQLVQFRWDPNKARSNLKKHGISFDEAVTVFADPLALIVQDVLNDERSILIGRSAKGRTLVTVFIEPTDEWIRIISARRATAHERRRYEEGDA